jgi:hypothetical protein
MMKKNDNDKEKSPSQLIDQKIAELDDWRGDMLRHVRNLIKQADPEITEEWKWVKPSNPGTPVWSHNGIVCTGESYKDHLKLTFAKGALIKDPAGLFTQTGTQRRAIDLHEGDKIDESSFKDLVRAAISLNLSAKKK